MNFKKEILNSIKIMIDQEVRDYKCDKTFVSVIKKVNPNGTYTILDDTGGERNVKCCIPGAELKTFQSVYVKVPMNDLKKMHICGVV